MTATAESGTRELRQMAQLTRVHALTIGTVLLVGVVVGLRYVALQDVPPGFFSDEASVAYDAKGIETDGRDSHGVLMPVFFQSFGTWRASLFIYVMALAFKVFGVGVVQARAVAATFSLLTALFLALLAWRLFRSRWLAVATFLVASVTPWLFTTGRFAFEPVSLPTVLAAFLLLWHEADRSGRWFVALAAGFALGLSVYAYISAWLFAPLLCVALVVAELPRPRLLLLAGAALGATLATVPMMFFLRAHPDALTARYQVVSVWLPGHPLSENLGRTWRVYTSGFSPEYLFQQAPWVLGGEFLAILAPLIVVGLVSLWRLRGERFWRLVLLGVLLAPIPGALTADFSHGLRNLEAVPFYLTLAMLGAWTLAPLLAGAAPRRRPDRPAGVPVALVPVRLLHPPAGADVGVAGCRFPAGGAGQPAVRPRWADTAQPQRLRCRERRPPGSRGGVRVLRERGRARLPAERHRRRERLCR